MTNQTDEQMTSNLDELERYVRNGSRASGFVVEGIYIEWQDLIKLAREGLKLREACPLIHTHCATCGIAIGVNGLCGCPDNRVHPIATIHKDAISTLTAELDSLRADKERLDWLEAHFGYGLINDDNGHWAISFDGIQSVGGGEEPADLQTNFYIEASKFSNSARECIDAARKDKSV